MEEQVILVDSDDREVGFAEKLEAHRCGILHRAFSAFVISPNGDMLLQRRARSKYHSPGLWSNTCCSHPRPGESVLAAANRRMKEEMGLAVPLTPAFAFEYRAELAGALIEHEYDHVLIGESSDTPRPSSCEVEDWRWVGLADIQKEMDDAPERFTVWFRLIFDRVRRHLNDES